LTSLGDSQWWAQVKQLGFRYVNGKYVYPSIPMRKKAVERRDYFESRIEFWEHLSRFGLPHYTDELIDGDKITRLTEDERANVDLYCASCPNVSSFVRMKPPYSVIRNGLFSLEIERASIALAAAASQKKKKEKEAAPDKHCTVESSGEITSNQVESESSAENITEEKNKSYHSSEKKDIFASSVETTSREEESEHPVTSMNTKNVDRNTAEAIEEDRDSACSAAELVMPHSIDVDENEEHAAAEINVNVALKESGVEKSEGIAPKDIMEQDGDQASSLHSMDTDDNELSDKDEMAMPPLMTQPCDEQAGSSDISCPEAIMDGRPLSLGSMLDDVMHDDGLSDVMPADCANTQKKTVTESDFDCSPLTPKPPIKSLADASPKIIHAMQCMENIMGVPLKGTPSIKGTPVSKDDAWVNVKEKMLFSGWRWQKGSGLITEYYVLPGGDVENGVEGEDYLTSEFEMKKFAYERFHWGGDGAFFREYNNDGRGRTRQRGANDPNEKQTKHQSNTKVRQKERKDVLPPIPEIIVKVKMSEVEEAEKRVPLPEKEVTLREKLQCCLQVLHPSYDANSLSHGNGHSSHLSSSVEEVRGFLQNVIRTWGAQSDSDNQASAATLYICGGPGTGKTSTVKHLCQEMSQWSIEHREELLKDKSIKKWNIIPSFCFVNVAHIQNSTISDSAGASNGILKRIARSLDISGNADEQGVEKRLDAKNNFNKRVLILVLDEVDMLLSAGSGAASGKTLLKKLMQWSANPHYLFAMIGISNSIDDKRARSLSELGTISKTVVFSAYRERDLMAILKERVGSKIVDAGALQLVARKVAAASGDARLALELTSNAVSKASDSLSDEQLSSETIEEPVVKILHMMRAVREGTGMKHAELIAGLPLAAKIILCVAMALSQVSSEWKVFTLGSLKKYVTEATRHGLIESLSTDLIYDLVGQLTDAGLLLTGDNNPGEEMSRRVYANPYDVPLQLGVQLDEVEFAIETTLNQHAFYSKMMEYVRTTNVHNR